MPQISGSVLEHYLHSFSLSLPGVCYPKISFSLRLFDASFLKKKLQELLSMKKEYHSTLTLGNVKAHRQIHVCCYNLEP